MWRFGPGLTLAALLAACQAAPAPQPAAPAEVEVLFHTDPLTGRTDGPFDPATGLRVQTLVDARGVLHVVLDPATLRPVLIAAPQPAAPGNGAGPAQPRKEPAPGPPGAKPPVPLPKPVRPGAPQPLTAPRAGR